MSTRTEKIRKEITAKLLQQSGDAIGGIVELLRENAHREASGEETFLNGYTTGALHTALELIADHLSCAGEDLAEVRA
jgi:hypothetical protein